MRIPTGGVISISAAPTSIESFEEAATPTDRSANETARSHKKAKIRAAIFMNRWLNDGEVEKWIKIIRKTLLPLHPSTTLLKQGVNEKRIACRFAAIIGDIQHSPRHPIVTIAWKNRAQL